MPRIDPDTVTAVLRETAQAEILPRFRHLAEAEVRDKGSGDLVTVADEAAEAVLDRRLTALLPGSRVLGEEAAARDPRVFTVLEDAEPVWVVDPVDGTGNFARGRETFAVMVALVQAGTTQAAWIHLPVPDTTLAAEAGAGALQDGRPLRLAPPPPSAAPTVGTLNASAFANHAMARQVDQRRQRLNTVRSMKCAGAEYVRLCRGETRFSLFTKLMPWDHAPGTLIFAEAGGHSRLLDGRGYRPTVREGRGLLHASDPDTWQRVYDTLFAGT